MRNADRRPARARWGAARSGRGEPALTALLLAVLTVAAFRPVLGAAFLNYDDGAFVTNNAVVQKGLHAAGLRWAFSTVQFANWQPVTWISHMLDVDLYGLDAGGHHGTSLLLHVATALALFFVLRALTGARGRSALVAGLFALHPLHVESVAWIAERRDVLMGLFWTLSLGAYAWYARRPSVARWCAVACGFALGLMSKATVITLPLVLLLLDFWPLRRLCGGPGAVPRRIGPDELRRALLEKVPLLALAAGFALLTYAAQRREGALGSLADYPLATRLANAAVSVVQYLVKTAAPTGLAVIYPHPGTGLPAWRVAGAALLVAALTAGAALLARRRPYLLAGWLWYLVALAPVAGVVQTGMHAFADRYTYLPLTGVFVALVWGAGDLLARLGRGALRAGAALSAVLLLVLAVATHRQAGYWRGDLALFSRAATAVPDNWIAERLLGEALEKEGRIDEAITHYRESLRVMPDFAETKMNLGLALLRQGQVAEGQRLYAEALRGKPEFRAVIQFNMGNKLREQGRREEAIACYREALRLKPDYTDARTNLEALLSPGSREPR